MCVVDGAAIGCREVWRLDPVKSEHLLGDRFVLRKNVRVRSCAGIGDLEQIQKCSDVHLLRVIACIGFRKVENEIGATFGESEQRLRAAVENMIRRLMTELLQGFEDLFAVLLYGLLLAFRLPL